MRRESLKRQALRRKVKAAERAFLEEHSSCARCGRKDPAIHHIIAGPNRGRALEVRAAWLPMCSICNCYLMEDKALWPLTRQLALKLITDPNHFDLGEINRLLAPEGAQTIPQRFTLADIVGHLGLIVKPDRR